MIKSIIKSSICAFLYYSGILTAFIRLYLYKKNNIPIVILIYHRITENIKKEINSNLTINHPIGNFRKEMQFIKKYFDVVSLDIAVELIRNDRKQNRPTIAVTFDDGFEDNYRLAFPILKELDIPTTIYLTSEYIGTNKLPWVEKLGESIMGTQQRELQLNSCFKNPNFKLRTLAQKRFAFNEIVATLKEMECTERIQIMGDILEKLKPIAHKSRRMLTWEEIKEMAEHNITFGAHTKTHPILSKMPQEQAREEIVGSKKAIEEKSGIAVKHFAYPNGRYEDFTEELHTFCKDTGFVSVATAEYRSCQLGSDIFALNRISPGKNMPIFAVDLIRGFLKKDNND